MCQHQEPARFRRAAEQRRHLAPALHLKPQRLDKATQVAIPLIRCDAHYHGLRELACDEQNWSLAHVSDVSLFSCLFDAVRCRRI